MAGVIDGEALQLHHQRRFRLGQDRGRIFRAAEQPFQLIRLAPLDQRQKGQQPVAMGVLAAVPIEPPAQPGLMAQQLLQLGDDLAAVGIADLAAGAEPGRDDRIGGTRNGVDLGHQVKDGLQPGSRGHG
ncbi:hypothetical protein [Rhodobacter capsulatus]|uniref:hypothetical protein n=1 Tax=Rhodobacter capsulatus TaxID=1061 RepID=UPI0040298B4A